MELLTGLCFCPACLDACARAGLDAVRLQVRVRTWAEQLLNEERGALPLSFRHAEPAALLLAIPGLADFLGWRATQVTRLVAEAAEAAHRYDAALEVIPASFHRPSSRAWLEGADLAGLARVADGLVILAYSADPAEVGADLQWAAACAPDRLLIAGLNACAPCDSASGLAAQATAARDAGATAIYYYNYGMLTERRLAWLATANRA